jgi:hypothetical protein
MFDLDAARAARREALGEAPEFVFGGRTYTLPVELSYTAALSMYRGDLEAGLAEILGQESYEEFIQEKPSLEDISALGQWISETYEDRKANAADAEDTGKTTKGKGKASKG